MIQILLTIAFIAIVIILSRGAASLPSPESETTLKDLPDDLLLSIMDRVADLTVLADLRRVAPRLDQLLRTTSELQLAALFDGTVNGPKLSERIRRVAGVLAHEEAVPAIRQWILPDQALGLYDRVMDDDRITAEEKAALLQLLVRDVNADLFGTAIAPDLATFGLRSLLPIELADFVPDPPAPHGLNPQIVASVRDITEHLPLPRAGTISAADIEKVRSRYQAPFNGVFPSNKLTAKLLIQRMGIALANRAQLRGLLRFGIRFDLVDFLQIDGIPDAVLEQCFSWLRTDRQILLCLNPDLPADFYPYLRGGTRSPPDNATDSQRHHARKFVHCVRYLATLRRIPKFVALLRRNSETFRNVVLFMLKIDHDEVLNLIRECPFLSDVDFSGIAELLK